MDEFALIRRYFAVPAPAREDVALGIGDDAALLVPSPGQQLVAAVDTLVAERHFPSDTAPFDIGWKALAVNLSDLAAMGATPRWFLLALTLPDADARWLEGFSAGLSALAQRHGVALAGGDTTRGPLTISITALGEVPAGAALRRDGARPGDRICVTGTLGDAAAALAQHGAADADVFLRERLDRPEPRVAAGCSLRGIASAAIDISDGLAGDLQHILDASGVGAEIHADRLPASDALLRLPPPAPRLAHQLTGGDDYELCVCIAPDRLDAARTALGDLSLTEIGEITRGRGLRVLDAAGATIRLDQTAYRHFS